MFEFSRPPAIEAEPLIGRALADDIVKKIKAEGVNKEDKRVLRAYEQLKRRGELREAYHKTEEALDRAAEEQPARYRRDALARAAARKRAERERQRQEEAEAQWRNAARLKRKAEAREEAERQAIALLRPEYEMWQERESQAFERFRAEEVRRRSAAEGRVQAITSELRRREVEYEGSLAAERTRHQVDLDRLADDAEAMRMELEAKDAEVEAARQATVAVEEALREKKEIEVRWQAFTQQQQVELQAVRLANETLVRERAEIEATLRATQESAMRIIHEAGIAHQEQERVAYEAAERARREEERVAQEAARARREEEARLARLAQDAMRAAVDHWNLYDEKWAILEAKGGLDYVSYQQFPLPIFADPNNAPSPSEITDEMVVQFVVSSYRPNMENKTVQEQVATELARWNDPDQIEHHVLTKVIKADREKTKEAIDVVVKCLSRMLGEVGSSEA